MSSDSEKTIMGDTPKHVQVANVVREQILNGSLSTGSRLCSDEELAKQYNVHRHTVGDGLRILVKEGLLERAPRRGSIVIAKAKGPVYLLTPCPDFFEKEGRCASFMRRLHKHLHLQLMEESLPLITIPMSPENDPENISDKYFDMISSNDKVVCCGGEWGLDKLNCLRERKCNVVFYDFQNIERSQFIDAGWKKLVLDRFYGAYNSIEKFSKAGFKNPLFILVNNAVIEGLLLKNVYIFEDILKKYPMVRRENIKICSSQSFEQFVAEVKFFMDKGNFDALYFNNVELAELFLATMKKSYSKAIISSDVIEIISSPEQCHYAIDFTELAEKTIGLFSKPAGTEEDLKPKLHNLAALTKKKNTKNN